MKGRMKRRNVVHDEFIMRTHWSEKSHFPPNLHSPVDPCYFWPTQTSRLVSGQLMTCLQLQLIIISHQRDHIIFSETRLWKGLPWTLKVGLSTHTHTQSAASTHSSFFSNPSLPLLFTYFVLDKCKARQECVFLPWSSPSGRVMPFHMHSLSAELYSFLLFGLLAISVFI